MQKYKIIIFSFLSLSLYVHAESSEKNRVDKAYEYISKSVLDTSSYLDKKIADWLGYDYNTTCLAPPKATSKTDHQSRKDVDSFFFNNKYINDTDDIYVRLRLKYRKNSRGSDKLRAALSAQLPFTRCKTQWKIFLYDINTNKPETKSTDTFSGGIGLRYDKQEYFGIDSSYSLGLYSGSPYIRGRFKLPFFYHKWKIEPVQIFKYSLKNYFEEETNIYFDKYLKEDQLFRLQLHRKTASKLRGMDYGLSLQFYKYIGKNAGLEFSQSFYGNTFYNDFYANDPHYHGINNYVTSIGWRSKIWRDWLYYEIRPSVNFHKDHNYRPTYSLRFYLDFYFGKYD